MESKKAATYLNRIYKGSRKNKEYNRDMVDKAIEIAEEEMIERALNAFGDVIKDHIFNDCSGYSKLSIESFKNKLSGG